MTMQKVFLLATLLVCLSAFFASADTSVISTKASPTTPTSDADATKVSNAIGKTCKGNGESSIAEKNDIIASISSMLDDVRKRALKANFSYTKEMNAVKAAKEIISEANKTLSEAESAVNVAALPEEWNTTLSTARSEMNLAQMNIKDAESNLTEALKLINETNAASVEAKTETEKKKEAIKADGDCTNATNASTADSKPPSSDEAATIASELYKSTINTSFEKAMNSSRRAMYHITKARFARRAARRRANTAKSDAKEAQFIYKTYFAKDKKTSPSA